MGRQPVRCLEIGQYGRVSTAGGATRTGPVTGVVFAVLFIGGVVSFGGLLGSFGDSDATFETYFASSSNRVGNLVGGALLGAAGLVFVWFLVHLEQWSQPDDGRAEVLPRISMAAGLVFVALLLGATAALVTVPFTLVFGDLFDEEGVLESGKALLPQLGFVLLAIYAMWAAAVMVATTTVAARRSGLLPRWICRVGFVATGFLVVLGPSVMGLFALPAWVALISGHWFRVQKRTRDAA